MTTTVWLTSWQLGDDGVRVAVGDRVDWLACLPAPGATERMFGGTRAVDHEIDAHRGSGFFVEESGDVTVSDGRVWSVRGVVDGVEAVTVAHRRTRVGDEVVDGSALAESIAATDERSWGMCRAHDPVGFIVTLHDAQVAPTEPTLDRSVWSAEPEAAAEEWEAEAVADASGWPSTLVDLEPPTPSSLSDPDAMAGESVVLLGSYDEQADASSWCRHPSHRA